MTAAAAVQTVLFAVNRQTWIHYKGKESGGEKISEYPSHMYPRIGGGEEGRVQPGSIWLAMTVTAGMITTMAKLVADLF